MVADDNAKPYIGGVFGSPEGREQVIEAVLDHFYRVAAEKPCRGKLVDRLIVRRLVNPLLNRSRNVVELVFIPGVRSCVK